MTTPSQTIDLRNVLDAWEWGIISHTEAMVAVRRIVGGERAKLQDLSRKENVSLRNKLRAKCEPWFAAPGKQYANQTILRRNNG